MVTKEIAGKITLIKENYQTGNITSEEMCELLDDLVCEIEDCEGPFGMGGHTDDDHYTTFEETDFTKLEI